MYNNTVLIMDSRYFYLSVQTQLTKYVNDPKNSSANIDIVDN